MKFVNCVMRLRLHLHVWCCGVCVHFPSVGHKMLFIKRFQISESDGKATEHQHDGNVGRNRNINIRKKQRSHATAVQTFCINTIWSKEEKKKPFVGTHSTHLNDFHAFSIFTSSTDDGSDGRRRRRSPATQNKLLLSTSHMQDVMHESVDIEFTTESRTATERRTGAGAKALSDTQMRIVCKVHFSLL